MGLAALDIRRDDFVGRKLREIHQKYIYESTLKADKNNPFLVSDLDIFRDRDRDRERETERDRDRDRDRERQRESPCYIVFHILLLTSLKKMISQKIAKTIFVSKVPFY